MSARGGGATLLTIVAATDCTAFGASSAVRGSCGGSVAHQSIATTRMKTPETISALARVLMGRSGRGRHQSPRAIKGVDTSYERAPCRAEPYAIPRPAAIRTCPDGGSSPTLLEARERRLIPGVMGPSQ